MSVSRCRNAIASFVALATACLLAACQTPPSSSVAALAIARPAALDQLLDDYVQRGDYPFLYARLEDSSGRVFYEHAAVNQRLFPGVTLDGDTWFRIWSMSKIVTISVALDLIEQGRLTLEDPVTRYIPEFEEIRVATSQAGDNLTTLADKKSACPLRLVPAHETMTIADLLNHEAGFYYATTGIPCIDESLAAANLPTATDSQNLVDRLAALPLIQQPGTRYFYGTNTTVLGIVAERATGKSLKQLVEEHVTSPLKISGLQYGKPTGVQLLPRVSGKDGELRVAHPGELDIFGPDVPDYAPGHALYLGGEGMLGTADGYTDFLRMLLNRGTLNGHRVLNATTIDSLVAPHTQTDSPYGHNGYNLWVNNGRRPDGSKGEGGLWIGGGYEGTHFWIDPKRDFVGVVMSQMYWVPKSGWGRDEAFREAVYEQIRAR